MWNRPDPEMLLPKELDDLLFDSPPTTMPEVLRRVLELGVTRVSMDDPRFDAVWAATRDARRPTVAEARALRALARSLADAFDAAPEDVDAWERAELTEALLGVLDTDVGAGAYEAVFHVRCIVEDDAAVLALVRAATTSAPPG